MILSFVILYAFFSAVVSYFHARFLGGGYERYIVKHALVGFFIAPAYMYEIFTWNSKYISYMIPILTTYFGAILLWIAEYIAHPLGSVFIIVVCVSAFAAYCFILLIASIIMSFLTEILFEEKHLKSF